MSRIPFRRCGRTCVDAGQFLAIEYDGLSLAGSKQPREGGASAGGLNYPVSALKPSMWMDFVKLRHFSAR